MSRRNIIILVTVLVIFGVLIAWYVFRGPEQVVTPNNFEQQQSEATSPTGNLSGSVSGSLDISEPEPIMGTDEAEMSRIGRIYAEKYGSYSTDSDFTGMMDLKVWSSEKMRDWLDTYVANIKKDYEKTEAYEGISSKVISSEVSIDGTDALYIAQIQKQEFYNNNQPKVSLQNLRIEFIQSGALWLVNAAYWE